MKRYLIFMAESSVLPWWLFRESFLYLEFMDVH